MRSQCLKCWLVLIFTFLGFYAVVINFWKYPTNSVTNITDTNSTSQKVFNFSNIYYMSFKAEKERNIFINTVQVLKTTVANQKMSAVSLKLKSPRLYVVVKSGHLVGRLGNQMFIYASLVGIATKQDRIPLLQNGQSLSEVFQINHIDKTNPTGWINIRHTRYGMFNETFFNLPKVNVTVYGFFQSWRFFSHVQEEIRREFTFRPTIHKKTTQFYNKLRENNTDTVFIGVHVRRSDFLTQTNERIGYDVPQRSYFVKAFNYIKNMVSNNTLFLVASDDMEWCRVNLNYTDVKLLEPDSPENHMSILANSDHVIISSGTFGWWCAWLAKGLKIYFKGFPRPRSTLSISFNKTDYYPPGWITLDN